MEKKVMEKQVEKINEKVYLLDGKEYRLKRKQSLKSWGKIISLLEKHIPSESTDASMRDVITLAADGTVEDLLNLMLDRELECEILIEDVGTVGNIIKDFFEKKKPFINSITQNLKE